MSSHEERMASFAASHPGRPPREGMTGGARRAIVVLFLLTCLLAGLNLLFTVRQVAAVQDALIASCEFDSDLGTAPITVVPPAKKAGLLGVKIVSDARVAWRGLGCPGKLAPPGKGFVHWAHYYGLPVD